MPTIVRYAVSSVQGDQPLREVADWIPEVALSDPAAVELEGYPGRWVLQSVSEPLVNLLSQHVPRKFNRFGELTEDGGQLVEGGTRDIYKLPLMDGYAIVDEDAYVTEWNKVAGAGQKIPERTDN